MSATIDPPSVGIVPGAATSPPVSCTGGGGFLISYSSPLDVLDTTHNIVDLSHATTCRIRLVSCQALLQHGILQIAEFFDFPTVPYAAISYPWRGVPVDNVASDTAFSVKGAEHADPVGVNALRSACAAALRLSCPYLWLDRLCIMQTDRTDKTWQIQHMYEVYRSCRVCLVLAGGVRRLVRLDEETPWIHRSWTLQEVLAPPSSVVLISWKLGPGRAVSRDSGIPVAVEEAIPGESAFIPLSLVLQVCTTGTLSFSAAPLGNRSARSTMVKACIFAAIQNDDPWAGEIPFWQPQRRIFSPNVVALSVAMDQAIVASDPEARNYAIWQSALMRTSSRPVDMVLSIMGLFGVDLDPAAFHKDDRRGATVALAQGILAAGGSASWMGAAFRLEPDRTLSTFSRFPQTSVAGSALVETKKGVMEISQLVEPVYPIQDALVPLPKGRMDDLGYLTLTAKAVRILPLSGVPGELNQPHEDRIRLPEALDGSSWQICDNQSTCSRVDEPTTTAAYAILLGWFHKYHPGASPVHGETILVILAEQHSHGPDLFHVRSFFTLRAAHKPHLLRWPEREFCLGGPDALSEAAPSTAEGLVETHTERQARWPKIPWSKPLVTLEDEAIRKARWAVPQHVLERYWLQE